jgi:hypothetical protein
VSWFRRASQSEPVVYDKAKYHYRGDWPKGLDRQQAFVHTGMYLGWLITRGMVQESEFEGPDGAAARDAFLSRATTGPTLFERWFDGVLIGSALTPEGNRFTAYYFDFDTGQYLADYEALLAGGLDELYEVRDTWANFDVLATRIDERLAEWRAEPGQ